MPAGSCAEIKASEGKNAISGDYWLDSIKPGEVIKAHCNMLIAGMSFKKNTCTRSREISGGFSQSAKKHYL